MATRREQPPPLCIIELAVNGVRVATTVVVADLTTANEGVDMPVYFL